MLKIDAHIFEEDRVGCTLERAEAGREWFNQHTYKCVPVISSNKIGWDFVAPVDVEFNWNGGSEVSDLTIIKGFDIAESHFGMGTLTLKTKHLFKTPDDWFLSIGDIPNHDRKSEQNYMCMSAIIESDKLSYPFFITLKALNIGITRISAGDRICRMTAHKSLEECSAIEVVESEETDLVKDQRLSLQNARGKSNWTKHYLSISNRIKPNAIRRI